MALNPLTLLPLPHRFLMTNKDHHFWVVLLFFSGVCILGYGCGRHPRPMTNRPPMTKTKPRFLPSGSLISRGSGVFDKSENDRRRRDPGESGSNSDETALPDPSIHQLTDTSEESDPVAPLEDGNLDPLPSAEIEREGNLPPSLNLGQGMKRQSKPIRSLRSIMTPRVERFRIRSILPSLRSLLTKKRIPNPIPLLPPPSR